MDVVVIGGSEVSLSFLPVDFNIENSLTMNSTEWGLVPVAARRTCQSTGALSTLSQSSRPPGHKKTHPLTFNTFLSPIFQVHPQEDTVETGKLSGYFAASGVQFCSSSVWINSQFTAILCAPKGNGELTESGKNFSMPAALAAHLGYGWCQELEIAWNSSVMILNFNIC